MIFSYCPSCSLPAFATAALSRAPAVLVAGTRVHITYSGLTWRRRAQSSFLPSPPRGYFLNQNKAAEWKEAVCVPQCPAAWQRRAGAAGQTPPSAARLLRAAVPGDTSPGAAHRGARAIVTVTVPVHVPWLCCWVPESCIAPASLGDVTCMGFPGCGVCVSPLGKGMSAWGDVGEEAQPGTGEEAEGGRKRGIQL